MEKSCPVLQISNFYIIKHYINFGSYDVIMSITTQGRVHFLMYLLNRKSFGSETWSTTRFSHGQSFYEKFCLA